MRPTTLLLVDDHALLRAAVRLRLETEPDLRVVADTGDAGEALHLAALHGPALMLTDLRIAGGGPAWIRRCTRHLPRMAVVVLSAHDDPAYAASALCMGARGYVAKQAPAARLVAAIRAVARGGSYFG